jgi:formylglycine-generating enzyme required for sulfatase activity
MQAQIATVLVWLLGLTPLVGLSEPAVAEKRVALVIGNSAYKNAPELANPKNDAADMSGALKALGVTVIEGIDLDKTATEHKISDFVAALAGADVGIFFYAGHGLQVNGVNYLVPIDAELLTSAALEFELIRLDVVQRFMEGAAKTNVLFLDACRNNPLSRNLARAMGTRSTGIGAGLAPVQSGVGTLISFSTQPGNVALDGEGRNSPFAGPLAREIAAPGEDVLSALITIRNAVVKETNGQQVPWETDDLLAHFYFNPTQPTEPPASTSTSVSQAGANEAARAWELVQHSEDMAALQAFRKQFGAANPFYDQLAASQLDKLKQAKEQATAEKKQHVAMLTEQGGKPASPPSETCIEVGRQKKCLNQGAVFRDCPECPEMVVAPAGAFKMGSPLEAKHPNEEPQHEVMIGHAFAVGRFAITKGEFTAFVRATNYSTGNKCWTYESGKWEEREGRSFQAPGFAQDDRHPVVCVNWNDARAFVRWLSDRTGKSYRLLTESEREFVTRAGSATPYWWGWKISTAQANFNGTVAGDDNPPGEWRMDTVPVDTFAPNRFGLYNVHGNAWDWVEDCWHENYQGAPTDGSAWTTGDCGKRGLRGGSWYDFYPWLPRSANRGWHPLDVRSSGIGFRVARSLSQ